MRPLRARLLLLRFVGLLPVAVLGLVGAPRQGCGSAAALRRRPSVALYAGRPAKRDGRRLQVASNRKARFDYQIVRTMEAGIALSGTEVKSCRNNNVNLRDGFARVEGGSVWLHNVDIAPHATTARYFQHEAKAKRRIGLGVTGLADALIFCGLRYGSPEAVAMVERWMAALRRHAYLASVNLAREKGAFPLFEADKYTAGESVIELDDDVKAAIAAHGIRNALVTSIAPTGTISLFADNVSSGLEPVFSFTYDRTVLMPDGSRKTEEVSDFAYRLFRHLKGETAPLTDAFVDAQSLTPRDHVVMQAAVQKYVDSSISKTINCPEDIAFDAFRDIYRQAYALGCKGCTTYRPNAVTGAVLATKREEPGSSVAQTTTGPEGQEVIHLMAPLDRPGALPGRTYKIKWPDSDHAIYITLNDIEQAGRRRPFEVFINSKNMEHFAWTVALTRMISAVFRRGGDVSFVVDELKAVFDPRGGHWMKGKYVPSLLAAIGGVIEEHMLEIGFLAPRDNLELDLGKPRQVVNLGGTPGQCPSCGSVALIRQEGCDLCTACGYSKCG